MRSRLISGAQAYDWGIATEFVADSELESVTDALVRELLTFSLHRQRAVKRLANDITECGSRFVCPDFVQIHRP